jgi:CBS-domain-containing membrane protein
MKRHTMLHESSYVMLPLLQVKLYSIYAVTNPVARVRERTIATELVPTFADRGCHVVSATDPYGRIHGFLYQTRCFFFQVAPQLYS